MTEEISGPDRSYPVQKPIDVQPPEPERREEIPPADPQNKEKIDGNDDSSAQNVDILA